MPRALTLRARMWSHDTGVNPTAQNPSASTLAQMFEHDRSAARGQMATRGLYVFEHQDKLGNAHAHALFDRLQVAAAPGAATPARDFGAYSVTFDGRAVDTGSTVEATPSVKLHRKA